MPKQNQAIKYSINSTALQAKLNSLPDHENATELSAKYRPFTTVNLIYNSDTSCIQTKKKTLMKKHWKFSPLPKKKKRKKEKKKKRKCVKKKCLLWELVEPKGNWLNPTNLFLPILECLCWWWTHFQTAPPTSSSLCLLQLCAPVCVALSHKHVCSQTSIETDGYTKSIRGQQADMAEPS